MQLSLRDASQLIVIPCFNHGAHLPDLLRHVQEELPSWDIVLVDDGCTDDSSLAAGTCGCHVIRHPENRGKGAALWTGIQWGLARGKEWFLFMDADGQHPAASIPWLLDAATAANATFVIGNRMDEVSSMPRHRRWSNRLTSMLLSWKTGQTFRDSQCGFRLVHRDCLTGFKPITRRYETETEILLHVARRGARFASVNIPTILERTTSLFKDICHASTGVSTAKVKPLFLTSEILSISGKVKEDTFKEGN